MTRFVPRQPDLFAAPAAAEALAPCDPIAELSSLLAQLRAADLPPWRDAAGAMAEELRALGLARQAGTEGARLASAILEETERLLAATD